MTRRLAFASLVALALTQTNCAITSDHFSCSVDVGGKLDRCVDYQDVDVQYRTTVQTLCTAIGGSFSTSKTCPAENKMGGCKQVATGYTLTRWYYQGEPVCSGPEHLVDNDGNGVDGGLQDLSAHDLASHD